MPTKLSAEAKTARAIMLLDPLAAYSVTASRTDSTSADSRESSDPRRLAAWPPLKRSAGICAGRSDGMRCDNGAQHGSMTRQLSLVGLWKTSGDVRRVRGGAASCVRPGTRVGARKGCGESRKAAAAPHGEVPG